MMGRRVTVGPHLYEVGDYGLWHGTWHGLPAENLHANLGAHTVTENPDGTITVTPSILVSAGAGQGSWHGYLENGVWRQV